MPRSRLYAYTVPPSKNVDPAPPVRGGALADFETLGDVIARTTRDVGGGEWINVSLKVDADGEDRHSVIRSALLSIAFKDAARAEQAALTLAERLATVMDKRSGDGCLMVVSVRRDGTSRGVTLWTFPRDEALQFSTGPDGPAVLVLDDAFSRRSHLHKAFAIEGPDEGPISFLTGRALDLQTGGAGQAANYWIENFLDAKLSVSGGEGSRKLARALRSAWDGTEDPGQRDQFHASAIAIRASTRRLWTIQGFAREFLEGEARAALLRTPEARKLRAERFRFDRDAFDEIVRWRVFSLENGIKVSAPFAAAERLLTFEQTPGGRRLTASGMIREEKVSQRG